VNPAAVNKYYRRRILSESGGGQDPDRAAGFSHTKLNLVGSYERNRRRSRTFTAGGFSEDPSVVKNFTTAGLLENSATPDSTAAGFSENSATPDSTAAGFSENSATPDSTAAGFSEKPATPPVL
jgi:hypothetical protein